MSAGRLRRPGAAAALRVAGAALACVALAAPGGAHQRGERGHAAAADPAAKRAASPVLVVRLDGVVSPVMDDALRQAIERATREGDAALVLEIDTPGGLESSMRAMIQRLLASEVPVIAWVSPAGGHAASAGVFIVMACDIAAMAPGTNIGAATPISLSGPMDSTLARKATNDAAAFARTVAAQRGRNTRWAERAVREAIAASETEAVRDSVVDFVARDEAELIERAHGRAWRRGDLVRTLDLRGRPLVHVPVDFRGRLLGHLADPNIAYLLMLLGFYGLIFELQNPGSILPGVVGGISLILAFFALSALPVNSAGVALLVLGLGFLLAEIKVQSHGILAVGGSLALFLGGLLLFRGGGVHVSWPVLLAGSGLTVAFFLVILGSAWRARRLPVATGAQGLIGRRGVVVERVATRGRVRLGDEVWNARSAVPIEAGAEIVVEHVDGLTLRVRPALQEG